VCVYVCVCVQVEHQTSTVQSMETGAMCAQLTLKRAMRVCVCMCVCVCVCAGGTPDLYSTKHGDRSDVCAVDTQKSNACVCAGGTPDLYSTGRGEQGCVCVHAGEARNLYSTG